MPDEAVLPEKAIVLRTGGVGDFVLTIPLIVSLIENNCDLTVATRPSYFKILDRLAVTPSFLEADILMYMDQAGEFREFFHGATVISFWKDSDGLLRRQMEVLGITRFVEVESRPKKPPHIVKRMFQAIGIQWEEDFMNRSWLQDGDLLGDSLWVHPGSGSSTKNAPVSWFMDRIESWLLKGSGDSVVVSFGEADGEVEECFRSGCGNLPLEFVHPKSISQLRDGLIERATAYIGNDSGPSHLAAAIGVPSEIAFASTDPMIWRPLGRKVTIVGSTD